LHWAFTLRALSDCGKESGFYLMKLNRRQTAIFLTGLRRWFLRNLLKTADCLRQKKWPDSVRFGIASLLCASQPRPTFARPLVACASFRSATPNPADTGSNVN
jgi:hypothetical protein